MEDTELTTAADEVLIDFRQTVFKPSHTITVTGYEGTPSAFDPTTATLDDAMNMIAFLLQLLKSKNLLQ